MDGKVCLTSSLETNETAYCKCFHWDNFSLIIKAKELEGGGGESWRPVFTELKMQTDFLAYIIGNSRQVILHPEMAYDWRQWVLFHC